jgi:hypothetical protein
MVGFAQFKPMIDELGGEDRFVEEMMARVCHSPSGQP